MFKTKLTKYICSAVILQMLPVMSSVCRAEWLIEWDNGIFYTDDVSLFSVTRRIALDEDPTQPVVDQPGQGSDFVYEPNVVLTFEHPNTLGKLMLRADAGAYVFFDKTDFNHGFYQLQLEQQFQSATRIKFFYDLIPDMLIDFNEPEKNHEHHHITESFEERLTSHIWTAHLDQKVDDHFNVRLLGRYGLRNYQEPFQYRDTKFWTIGTHLEWEIHSGFELKLGYHYEPGTADQNPNSQLHDDISYITHYFSTELSIELFSDLELNLIFDFEHNNFSSEDELDFHYQAHENIYQGEIEFVYAMNKEMNLIVGWQHGQRKFNFEQDTIKNNNIWFEFEYTFHI